MRYTRLIHIKVMLKMKKHILYILMFIMFISIVNADWLDDSSCEVNTDCIMGYQFINETSGELITDANCTIDIYSPSGYLWVNDGQMINHSNGYYNYTINFNTTGRYPADMSCNQTSTNAVDSADVTFQISAPFHNWFYIFLFFIPLILLILGEIYNETALRMISGFLFCIYGISIFMQLYLPLKPTDVTDALSVFLIGTGLYLILDCSITYVKEVKTISVRW